MFSKSYVTKYDPHLQEGRVAKFIIAAIDFGQDYKVESGDNIDLSGAPLFK
jgi:hypothetical protein